MSGFRSGFVALLGKPNVGKSSLLNRLVGTKVAIVSSKPQTTRRRILGVLHGGDHQIVFVDTPGMAKPLHALGRKMLEAARSEGREADMIVFVTEVTHEPTSEDRSVVGYLRQLEKPLILVGNKLDLRSLEEGLQALAEYRRLADFELALPVSAHTGQGLAQLVEALEARLPEGPPFFPADQVTDQNQRILIEEILREKVLRNTRQEIPHSVAVQVEEMRPGEDPSLLYVSAYLYVERDSQKGIVIGKGGALLKKIGAEARQELEGLLGQKIFLDLWVKVKHDWREREDWLAALGY
ncbi:MAG: GTPase Era [Armatimonadetes bacterium]|nr:GTPase Era [Armatimonadota bacterium]